MSKEVVANLRKADKSLDELVRYGVPISVGKEDGKELFANASYRHVTDPPIIEKKQYAQALTGERDVKPIIQITDDDVEALKAKAWLNVKRDFYNWLGTKYNPAGNPANRELLKKLCPEFFTERQEDWDNYIKLVGDYQKAKIAGAKDIRDLMLLYRTDKEYQSTTPGAVNYDEDLAAMVTKPESEPKIMTSDQAQALRTSRNFEKGIFNIRNRLLYERAIHNPSYPILESKPEIKISAFPGSAPGREFTANPAPVFPVV